MTLPMEPPPPHSKAELAKRLERAKQMLVNMENDYTKARMKVDAWIEELNLQIAEAKQ